MNSGWICLHRSFIEWEWYGDINTSRLFIHLLITANHKEKKWRGITIKKGEILTSQIALSEKAGLSRQQTRACLNKLKATNDITIKTSTQHTVITINNWGKYQYINQQFNQRATNEQPTSNQRATTNNNEEQCNNVTKPKREKRASDVPLPDFIDEENYKAFETMRKKIKKPITTRIKEMLIEKLTSFYDQGFCPNKILKNSEHNYWQDVYEPKPNEVDKYRRADYKKPKNYYDLNPDEEIKFE